MSKSRLIALLVALFALAVPATASAGDALDPQQWGLTNTSMPGHYLLFNQQINKAVGHGDRTWGVDLDWGQDRGYWRFLRPNRDHRGGPPLGEKVAMYNTKVRRYLVYGSQTSGINLKWSRTPGYEWRLDKLHRAGGVALFNTAQNDYVVYGKRSWGINLRWLKDLRASQPDPVGTVRDASVYMQAQPPVQGFVPFLGSYGGGGTKAVLTKVTVPSNGATLFFVKPGRSSSQCGNPDAVIRLNAGQTMTADQMKAIWNSATPSLAQPVPFLACAATQASTVAVNVQYRVTG